VERKHKCDHLEKQTNEVKLIFKSIRGNNLSLHKPDDLGQQRTVFIPELLDVPQALPESLLVTTQLTTCLIRRLVARNYCAQSRELGTSELVQAVSLPKSVREVHASNLGRTSTILTEYFSSFD
jgi:hypothetical protein